MPITKQNYNLLRNSVICGFNIGQIQASSVYLNYNIFCNSSDKVLYFLAHRNPAPVTVHICPKSRTAANCNGIQPMESSPSAKGWMLGRSHSLALPKQQVLEQGVNSNQSLPSHPAIDFPSRKRYTIKRFANLQESYHVKETDPNEKKE